MSVLCWRTSNIYKDEAASKEIMESVSRILNLSELNQPASVRRHMNDTNQLRRHFFMLHIHVKAINIQELKQDICPKQVKMYLTKT